MGFLRNLLGDSKTPGGAVAVVDVDDFDHLNKTLGRAVGDHIIREYLTLVADHVGHTTFLKEAGFRAWLRISRGKTVEHGEMLRKQLEGKRVVACRAFASGDEIFFHLADHRAASEFVTSLQKAADAKAITVRNSDGLATHVVQGLPLSVGVGDSWDSAWRALCESRERSRTMRPLTERVRPANLAEQIVRDRPGVDSHTGLPSTFDVVTEDSPDGKIPVLMWGPVVVRRPGWTDEHQKEMLRAIARLAMSKGITDREKIVALVVEVTELRNRAWQLLGDTIQRQQR